MSAKCRIYLYGPTNQTLTILVGRVFFFLKQIVKTCEPVMGNMSTFLLASTAGIALKQPDDGGVALRSFHEFFKRQFT